MPVYEYHWTSAGGVEVTLTIKEHGKAKVACPKCDSTAVRPLMSTFFSDLAVLTGARLQKKGGRVRDSPGAAQAVSDPPPPPPAL
jgi:putative FmdB family regulatory protein